MTLLLSCSRVPEVMSRAHAGRQSARADEAAARSQSWCISQFADGTGCVSVLRRAKPTPFDARPENVIFCALRVWDEQLEHGFFKKIEDAFHAEVGEILRRGTVQDHTAVNRYLAVWELRSRLKETPLKDSRSTGHLDHHFRRTRNEPWNRGGTSSVKARPFREGSSPIPGRSEALTCSCRATKHPLGLGSHKIGAGVHLPRSSRERGLHPDQRKARASGQVAGSTDSTRGRCEAEPRSLETGTRAGLWSP
jgi:hypothetical protein